MLHGLNRTTWEKMQDLDALEFLTRNKDDGKIINAGFSFHGDKETFAEIVDAYDWDFCQIQYNYMDEESQAGKEGLKYAADKGMGIMIMEPLRGGNIARNIPPEIERIWNLGEIKRSPVEWALRWVWNHPEVSVVLSGMNEEAHIEENLHIANQALPNSLTEEDLKLIEEVKNKYRELMKTGCTGCRYCMPCPVGVDIPLCFEIYDGEYSFGNKRQAKIHYAFGLGISRGDNDKTGFASKCRKCGKCEKHCPQELPITELLEDVSHEIEGFSFQILFMLARIFTNFQRIMNNYKAKKIKQKKNIS